VALLAGDVAKIPAQPRPNGKTSHEHRIVHDTAVTAGKREGHEAVGALCAPPARDVHLAVTAVICTFPCLCDVLPPGRGSAEIWDNNINILFYWITILIRVSSQHLFPNLVYLEGSYSLT